LVRIEARSVSKRYGEVRALDDVNLSISNGELFTVLGPSGCGKTTFLRTVAGFELVDAGRIFFDDVNVTMLPAHKRNAGMVFQNYALWPHMSVFDNVAYGLKVRKVGKSEAKERVERMLALVKLEGMGDRTPHQLSGGQQQRVALARALVINPGVLLLDEPLSNLDAKLRLEMRTEIRRIQRDLGITTLYVTHDQEEAMSISDRIAVMYMGKVVQVDSPRDLYFRPKSQFVSEFIGQGTFLKGKVSAREGGLYLVKVEDSVLKATPSDPAVGYAAGDDVLLTIRPESFRMGSGDGNVIKCSVVQTSFLGKSQRILASFGSTNVTIEADPLTEVSPGQAILVSVEPSKTLMIKA
jgi:ABC-type Fe3+/spermidine/putrescine transport system ATPase subunit